MAATCPVCRSDLVQGLANADSQCLSCYAHWDGNGKVLTESQNGSTMPTPGEYQ